MLSATNHISQKIPMNGAARNGMGRCLAIATAAAATTTASTITVTQSAMLG